MKKTKRKLKKNVKKLIFLLLAILTFAFMQFVNSWQSVVICLTIIAMLGIALIND